MLLIIVELIRLSHDSMLLFFLRVATYKWVVNKPLSSLREFYVRQLVTALFHNRVEKSLYILQWYISWSICISKFRRIVCILFFRTDSALCIYHLVVWVNLFSCTLHIGLLSFYSKRVLHISISFSLESPSLLKSFLSILKDHNNAVVWVVSIRTLI